MTGLEELTDWAAALKPDAVPPRVRDLAVSQIVSQAAAIRTGAAHPLGHRVTQAFGPALGGDPRTSACVLSSLGSWLNLDDTAFAGHLSNSTVSVPLAFAYAGGLTGAELITAVVAANECAARLTAAATLGTLRGQSAVHTHLAGSVAGRLHCEGAPAKQWTDAMALAFSMPNWPMMCGFLDSDARLFNSFTPVRSGMDACDAAAVGLHGTPDILDHQDGFLQRFATVPLPQLVADGLGRRWYTETLSFKMRPGGPGIDAAVDCALELHEELGPDAARIEEVRIEASLYTLVADRIADPYVRGPRTPLGALVLYAPYPVATALLTGQVTVEDFARPRVDDPARWRLVERVRLLHDMELTRELFASHAPFGEAVRQAGEAAAPWLGKFCGPETAALAMEAASGPPDPDFSAARKATGARVTVVLPGGRTLTRQRLIPIGAAGPETRERHTTLVREKFLHAGGSPDVAEAALGLAELDGPELRRWIEAALA
jgi:2-methylcitrate dehydratase PrpD